jgi:hypothetical protein
LRQRVGKQSAFDRFPVLLYRFRTFGGLYRRTGPVRVVDLKLHKFYQECVQHVRSIEKGESNVLYEAIFALLKDEIPDAKIIEGFRPLVPAVVQRIEIEISAPVRSRDVKNTRLKC